MATITRSQVVAVTATSSPTLAWTTTAGNLLLVAVRPPNASSTCATPSGWQLVTSQIIGTGTRTLYIFSKIAVGGTSDQQAFVGSAGSVTLYGWEFAVSGGGTWSIGTTQGTDWQSGQNATGTAVTCTAMNTASTNPALQFVVGASQAQSSVSISSVASGGSTPDTPSGSVATMMGAWGQTTTATSESPAYSDGGANNRTVIQVTASFTASGGANTGLFFGVM